MAATTPHAHSQALPKTDCKIWYRHLVSIQFSAVSYIYRCCMLFATKLNMLFQLTLNNQISRCVSTQVIISILAHKGDVINGFVKSSSH